jgi:hypothetical protein
MIYEGDSIEKRYQKPLPVELADEMMRWGREKLRLNELKVPRLKFKMDLEAKGILAEAYNRTSLCGFEYSKQSIPNDDQIINDLEFL